MQSRCIGNLATFQVAISINRILGGLLKRNTSHQLLCHCKREWSFILEMTEANTGGSLSNEKQTLECLASANEQKDPMEASTFVFINHAAIAWHERRREWVGDQSQKSKRKQKDPIISWSMTYEDLLSTNEPFSEPIPLTEMVDFLVDIWQDEGLYD